MLSYHINGKEYTSEEVEASSYIDFIIHNRPTKLFKYFANEEKIETSGHRRNYSIESLENNTVHLQSPINFDDPYDSNLNIDTTQFKEAIIRYCMEVLNIESLNCDTFEQHVARFVNYIISNVDNLKNIHRIKELLDPLVTIQSAYIIRNYKNSILINRIIDYLKYNQTDMSFDKKLYKGICNAIFLEYLDTKKFTQENFKVSCFTTTPYSVLMWSQYANNHKGFCVEYDMTDNGSKNKLEAFVMPVFYTNERKDLLKPCMSDVLPGEHGDKMREAIFKYGLLAKSDVWKYQSEWRLVSYLNYLSDENNNCNFFKITKVYLGCKMSIDEKVKIMSICKKKDISCVCLKMEQNSYNLIDCNN